MAGYTIQGKNDKGAMVEIPLAAQYDANGNDISLTYSTKDELKAYLPTKGGTMTGRLVINKAGSAQTDTAAGHIALQKNGTDYAHIRPTAGNSNLAIESKGGIILYGGTGDSGTEFSSANYVGIYSGSLRGNGTIDLTGFRNLSLSGTISHGSATLTLPSKTGTLALKEDITGGGGSVDLSNYVTLDTEQTIAGKKTFSAGEFTVGSANDCVKIITKDLYGSKKGFSIITDKMTYIYDLPANKGGTIALTSDITWANLANKPTIPDASNLVTLSGAQTIKGTKTFKTNPDPEVNKGCTIGDYYSVWNANIEGVNYQTDYQPNEIIQSVDTGLPYGQNVYHFKLPKKSGTFALAEDLSTYLPKSGGTMTGNLKVGSSSIGTNGYITGTWLQTTANTHLTSAAPKVAVLDNSGWVYHRTLQEFAGDMGAAIDIPVQIRLMGIRECFTDNKGKTVLPRKLKFYLVMSYFYQLMKSSVLNGH